MNPWLTQLTELLRIIFQAPKVDTLLFVQAGIALLLFLITFHLSGWALHVGYATWPRTVLTVLLVLGLPLGFTLAFQVLALPQLPAALPALWALGVMVGILLLGVIVPLLTLLLKTSFLQILIMIAFSTFAAFVATLLFIFIMGSFERGTNDFNKVEKQRDMIDSTTSDLSAPTTDKP